MDTRALWRLCRLSRGLQFGVTCSFLTDLHLGELTYRSPLTSTIVCIATLRGPIPIAGGGVPRYSDESPDCTHTSDCRLSTDYCFMATIPTTIFTCSSKDTAAYTGLTAGSWRLARDLDTFSGDLGPVYLEPGRPFRMA